MWNWFKKDKPAYPHFWEEYQKTFSDKLENERFVVFDCETTGLEKSDVLLSIGAVTVVDNRILVSDHFECFITQENYKPSQIAVHGILKEGESIKIPEQEAIEKFLTYIKNATLIGHHIAFDIGMINNSLKKMGLPKLKNKSLDTDALYQKYKHLAPEQHTSLDKICEQFQIPKTDRHTAIGDAYLTARVYLKLKAKI